MFRVLWNLAIVILFIFQTVPGSSNGTEGTLLLVGCFLFVLNFVYFFQNKSQFTKTKVLYRHKMNCNTLLIIIIIVHFNIKYTIGCEEVYKLKNSSDTYKGKINLCFEGEFF